jgi:oxygen-dependent protoporphyrinogen oxidase
MMPRAIAVIGGGIAGLTAAYELNRLQQQGADITLTLFEASRRLGGIVETVRHEGFVMETGPDAWVTEKPWAREIAEELGLGGEIIQSNDAERVTYVLRNGQLLAMPDGMRMMVPSDLGALEGHTLFSNTARKAYAEEPARAEDLKRQAPPRDEPVATFVTRHFGEEVLRVVGAPLLNGVFGGDVRKLSVQAVMAPFVKMEREHGSLITAVQQRDRERGDKPRPATFTTLRSGMGTLADRMAATLPANSIVRNTTALELRRTIAGWIVRTVDTAEAGKIRPLRSAQTHHFREVLLATPVAVTARLLHSVNRRASQLVDIPSSSAVTVAFAFAPGSGIAWPRGFGFLAPPGEGSQLLAATFADQKFPDRAPAGGRLVRAYFGGPNADKLIPQADDAIAQLAHTELQKIVGPLPAAAFTVVRRWPRALPQYEVGHLTRMAELDRRIAALGNLHLLGNGYRGVGVPDLIRDARAAARTVAAN